MSTYTTNETWADKGRASYDMTVGKGHVGPQNIWDLAIDAGAMFNVEGIPLGYQGGEWGDEFTVPSTIKDVPLSVMHVRTDNNAVLAVHPGSYKVRTGGYFSVMEQIEETFPDSCTKVSVLDKGRKLMTQHQIGESLDLPNGDKLLPTIIGIAALDSTWSTQLRSFAHVLSCTNMLSHTSTHLSVKATRNHDSMLANRMWILRSAMIQAKTIARIARISADIEFTDHQFKTMVEELPDLATYKAKAEAPRYDKDGLGVPQHMKTVNTWEDRRAALMRNWGKEKELKGGAHKWAAFNAVQGAEQHTISVGFGKRKNKDERRMIQLVDSPRRLENQAFRYLGLNEFASV